jgi:hypothetical protein
VGWIVAGSGLAGLLAARALRGGGRSRLRGDAPPTCGQARAHSDQRRKYQRRHRPAVCLTLHVARDLHRRRSQRAWRSPLLDALFGSRR